MDKIVLFDIDYTLFDTAKFKESNLQDSTLYTEVLDVLRQVSKIAKLGIFSEGQLNFQKDKLTKTKIKIFFEEECVHIVDQKDLSLKKVLIKYKDKDLYLIDDKLTILVAAKKINPEIFTIWVKRGIYADSQVPVGDFSPNAVVEDLKDVYSIISNN